jgi:hypothetical protein
MPLAEGRYWWGVVPPDPARGDGIEGRLAGAGQWYMAALEPVTKVVGTIAITPLVLVMCLLPGCPGSWG